MFTLKLSKLFACYHLTCCIAYRNVTFVLIILVKTLTRMCSWIFMNEYKLFSHPYIFNPSRNFKILSSMHNTVMICIVYFWFIVRLFSGGMLLTINVDYCWKFMSKVSEVDPRWSFMRFALNLHLFVDFLLCKYQFYRANTIVPTLKKCPKPFLLFRFFLSYFSCPKC